MHSPAKCPLDRRVRRLAVAEPDALEWLLLRLPFGFPSANVPEVVGPWWFWKGNMRRQSGLNSSSCSMGTCAKHRASFSGNCHAQAKLMFILCRVILHYPVQPAINKLWGCKPGPALPLQLFAAQFGAGTRLKRKPANNHVCFLASKPCTRSVVPPPHSPVTICIAAFSAQKWKAQPISVGQGGPMGHGWFW